MNSQKEYMKKYRDAHKEKISEYGKKYYQKTRETSLERSRKYHQIHKEEINKKRREEYKIDSTRFKRNLLKFRFNLTLDDLDKMRKIQNNRCAICKRKEPIKGRGLAIDHDHKTGKIRALLCSHCNKGLGYFSDNPELLNSAIQYLNSYL